MLFRRRDAENAEKAQRKPSRNQRRQRVPYLLSKRPRERVKRSPSFERVFASLRFPLRSLRLCVASTFRIVTESSWTGHTARASYQLPRHRHRVLRRQPHVIRYEPQPHGLRVIAIRRDPAHRDPSLSGLPHVARRFEIAAPHFYEIG